MHQPSYVFLVERTSAYHDVDEQCGVYFDWHFVLRGVHTKNRAAFEKLERDARITLFSVVDFLHYTNFFFFFATANKVLFLHIFLFTFLSVHNEDP